MSAGRIWLSPPWTGGEERKAVEEAFDSGYVAPCGPRVDRFEKELAALSGRRFAVAVSGGTAALDLLAEHFKLDPSWTVVAPSLTFIASVSSAARRGAAVWFVDSAADGNADPALAAEALEKAVGRSGPKTMFLGVDLYGRCVRYGEVEEMCDRAGALFVSDSAESVGATSGGRPSGSAGVAAVYSFNGNKIVTTSGGGAVLADSPEIAAHVRSMSQQSRENVPWYEHRELGFNYRMSNILAAVGSAQLAKLPEMLSRRAANARFYARMCESLDGCSMLPPVEGENHWLNVMLFPDGARRDRAMDALAARGVESRPVWKPMHMQKVFEGAPVFGGAVSEDLFARGLCLPSGTGMEKEDLERVASILFECEGKEAGS